MTGQQHFSSRPILALAVMAAICALSSAQPALPTCLPAQATLSSCISYFIGNTSSPSTECCTQIQAMFESQEPCLCAMMAGAPAGQLGSAFGQAQALLPSSCNIPHNACTGTSTAPTSASTTPSGTTAAAASPSATDPTAPSGAGLKSLPELLGSAAAGRYRGISAATVLIPLVAAYVASIMFSALLML